MKRYGICNIVGCVAICGILCGAIATIGGYDTVAAEEGKKRKEAKISPFAKRNIDLVKKGDDSETKKLCNDLIEKYGEGVFTRALGSSAEQAGLEDRFLKTILDYVVSGVGKIDDIPVEIPDENGKPMTPESVKSKLYPDLDKGASTVAMRLGNAAKRLLAVINKTNVEGKVINRNNIISATASIATFNKTLKDALGKIVNGNIDSELTDYIEGAIKKLNEQFKELRGMTSEKKGKKGASYEAQLKLQEQIGKFPDALKLLIDTVNARIGDIKIRRDLEKKIAALKEELALRSRTMGAQRDEDDKLRGEIATLEKDREELQEKVAKLEKEAKEKGKVIDELKKEIKDKDKKIAELDEAIKGKDEKIEELQKEIDRLKRELEGKNVELGNATANVQKLTMQMYYGFKALDRLALAIWDSKEDETDATVVPATVLEDQKVDPDDYREYRTANDFDVKEMNELDDGGKLEIEREVKSIDEIFGKSVQSGTAAKEKSLKKGGGKVKPNAA